MPWTQLLLSDREGAYQQRLGLLVLALFPVEYRQIVEALGRVGMIRSQLLLPDSEGALVQWLGLLVLALAFVEVCQVVEAFCRVEMIRS